jgi:hypothetical protein
MLRKILFSLLLFAAFDAARGQTIDYFQNFPANSSGSGSVAMSSYNWSGYYGNSSTNAVAAVAGMGGSVPNAQVSSGGNATTYMNNVNATAPGGSTDTKGVAFFASPNNTYSYILLTSEYAINTNGGTTEPADFTWYGAGNIGDTQRLAVEIDSQWYVNTNVLTISGTNTTSAGNFGADEQQDFTTFGTAASSWQLLNFSTTGASTLSVGCALTSPLPSDNIMAFGVYLTGGQTTADKDFIDNFEVDSAATPEPATGLLLLAPPALLRKRRR